MVILDGFINILKLYCIVVCVILPLYLVLVQCRNKDLDKKSFNKLIVWKVLLFGAIPIILMSLCSHHLEKIALTEVRDFLSHSDSKIQISVNGVIVQDYGRYLPVLQDITRKASHRSHDTGKIEIVIRKGSDNMELFLGRDSQIPTEYWVFYPKYKHTTRNEIGRITTNVFDGY